MSRKAGTRCRSLLLQDRMNQPFEDATHRRLRNENEGESLSR